MWPLHVDSYSRHMPFAERQIFCRKRYTTRALPALAYLFNRFTCNFVNLQVVIVFPVFRLRMHRHSLREYALSCL